MEKNLNFTKIKATAILNIVNAFLCVALAIAFYVLLKIGVIGSGNEGLEGLGFAFVLIVFLPLSIILYVPILIDAIYKTVFSIVLLNKTSKVKVKGVIEVKKSLYVLSLVFKIISCIALGLETVFISALISAGGTGVLALIFTIIIALTLIFQIALIFIENSSKREVVLV